MKRIFILPAVALLLIQASFAMAQQYTITVSGKLAGGNQVMATCILANNGSITGTGTLMGYNAATKSNYYYPFTITHGTTTKQGQLVLTGKINGGPNMALSATPPAGAMVFSYVVNGNTYSLPGQGTVTVK